MKKVIIITITVIVLGGGALIAYNVTSAPEEVPQSEGVDTNSSAAPGQSARQGMFNEQDRIHKGTGRAILEGSTLRLDQAFTVTDGPDLYVYLSKDPQGKDISDAVSLGRLKSIKGNQTYTLPKNSGEFKSVIIYCRAFKQSFSVAPLQ